MGIIEQVGQEERQEERARRESGMAKRIAMEKLTEDDRESRLFAAYFEQQDPAMQELYDKLVNKENGQLTEADYNTLYQETEKFFAIEERARKVMEKIKSGMEAIVDLSPELSRILKLDPKAVEMGILGRLEEIAIVQPDVLISLEGTFAVITAEQGAIDAGNKQITEYCEKYGFTADEYREALRKRRAGDVHALENLVDDNIGLFGKIKQRFGNYEKFMGGVNEGLDNHDFIKDRLTVVNDALAQVGGILRTTIFSNAEARQILEANVAHKEMPAQRQSFMEARGINTDVNDDEIRLGRAEYEREHSGDPGYTSDIGDEGYAREFTSNRVRNSNARRRGGWTSCIANLLFSRVRSIL